MNNSFFYRNIIIVTFLLQIIVGKCSPGCLKCDYFQKCLLADFVNFYFVSNNVALKSSIQNCLKISNHGFCTNCMDGFYYSSQSNMCIQVDNKIILNCKSWSNPTTCVCCAKNYYLLNGLCNPVETTVPNCITYIKDGLCSNCNSGYQVTPKGTCIEIPFDLKNCVAFNFLSCSGCINNYQLSNTENYNEPNLMKGLGQIFEEYHYPKITIIKQNSCSMSSDFNCLIRDKNGVCISCKNSLCLDQFNTCVSCPIPVIQGCEIYSSLTTCLSCIQGYYISNLQCIKINPDYIPGCKLFNPASMTIICIECLDSFYLYLNKCFTRRNYKIKNCIKYDISRDYCQKCSYSMILLENGLKCVSGVQNCLIYNNYTLDNVLLTCKQCKDRHWLNSNNECNIGELRGCIVYLNKYECLKCDQNYFYINQNKCQNHISIFNCLIYDSVLQNRCSICHSGYFAISYDSLCSVVNHIISNCIAYDFNANCLSCQTGYFLTENNCLQNPQFCTLVDRFGNCIVCNDGYLLLKTKIPNTCVSILSFIALNCNVYNDNSISQNIINSLNIGDNSGCYSCKLNNYPTKVLNSMTCMNKNEIFTTDVKGSTAHDQYCNKFKFDSSTNMIECVGCVDSATIDGVVTTIYTIGNFNLYDLTNVSCTAITPSSSSYTFVNSSLSYIDKFYVTNSYNSRFSNINCTNATITYDSANTSLDKISLFCTKFITINILKYVSSFFISPTSNEADLILNKDPFGNIPNDIYFNGYLFKTDSGASSNQIWSHNLPVTDTTNFACELAYLSGVTYYCLRCKWGYTVKYNGTATSCTLITNCNTSTKYSGLSYKLNMYLSCHSCSSSNLITLNLIDNTFHNSSNTNSKFMNPVAFVNNMNTVMCRVSASFINPTTFNSISNCQIYYLRFNSTYLPLYNTTSLTVDPNFNTCVACTPGFKPSVTEFDTVTCSSSIINSILQTRLNSPSKCNSYHAFSNDLSECVKSLSNNCLIVSKSTVVISLVTYYKCQICSLGYFVDIDGMCISLILPNCSSNYSYSIDLPRINSILDIKMINLFLSNSNIANNEISPRGCGACNLNFYKVLNNGNTNYVCLNNSYSTLANSTLSAISLYVKNCNQYVVDNPYFNEQHKCFECNTGYIIASDGLKCIASIVSTQNCQILDSTNNSFCNVCKTGYLSDNNGSCQSKSVTYCQSYTPSDNKIICKKCNEGYYLKYDTNYNSCSLGNIYGCANYFDNNPNSCVKCINGKTQIYIDYGLVYCIDNDNYFNCDSGLAFNSTNNNLYCPLCNSNYYPRKINTNHEVQTYCKNRRNINNCVQYDDYTILNKIEIPKFTCLNCLSSYYVDPTGFNCLPRNNISRNCVEYVSNKDLCKKCTEEYFVNASTGICQKSPYGIANCDQYTNISTCKYCITGYYLSQIGVCIRYNGYYIINCKYIDSSGNCLVCQNNYFLSYNICKLITAKNCYTLKDFNKCEKCDPSTPMYSLIINQDWSIDCMLNTSVNCYTAKNYSLTECSICITKYYPGVSGICQPANEIIGCLYYLTQNACMKCNSSYVLLSNGLCDSIYYAPYVDNTCTVNQELSFPECVQCRFKFDLINGKCYQTKKYEKIIGCFISDVSKLLCEICDSGYYQNENGFCILNHEIKSS